MSGYPLPRVEVKARVKFNDKEIRDVDITFDNKMLSVYSCERGYIIVLDDDFTDTISVIWGETPKDALQAYYDTYKGYFRAEVLEATVTRIEDLENEEDIDEESEEEFWELADIDTPEEA